ncbi:hypothetical protein [Mesobacillus jeotgali]|uniref:hypothetical protein n=1 Tax=Mesobacillus jeotgali TaxID=129985 RepID=UPI001785F0EA|nr:hypothetical protein [Mesobacillus jeotgali]UYZ21742.1 hypothetical protein FOF60_22550 [Mesobacillus jeotgali]
MKKTKDLIVDLDMIHESLLNAKEDADNPILKGKIGNISNQLSNLIKHLDNQIKNPPPKLQKSNRNRHNNPILQQPGYYTPGKKKKVHFPSQGRNATRISSAHTIEGKFKY